MSEATAEVKGAGRTAKGRAEDAAHSRWLGWLGRAGLAAQGVSFAIVAVLAIQVAVGSGGKTADRGSALQTLADDALGKPLLVALALGFVGYAVWRFALAFFDREGEGDDAKGLAKRSGDFGKGVLYAGLTVTVVKVLASGGRSGGGGGGTEKKATGGVLDWPGGRWIVAAAGLAVFGAALFNLYRGLSRSFEDDLKRERMSHGALCWLSRVGMVGLSARAVVFGVAGWFLVKAALQYDPKEAVGLGGALAKLAQAPYGPFLLGGTAAGLLAFAAFCVGQAIYRRV